MNYYFIDSENVSGYLLTVDFKKNSKIYNFIPMRKAPGVNLDVLSRLVERKCEFVNIQVNVGTKNAMDYQLVTYLGSLLRKDQRHTYYIVSRDKGYDGIVDYWRKQGYNVIRYEYFQKVSGKSK